MDGQEGQEGDSVDLAETQQDTEKYLTTSEFVLMNLSRQYSLEDYSLYKYADPSKAFNMVQVIVAYVLIGVPIGYMEIILGQFTNQGMFHIKHLMPIAEGMSYTFCLLVAAIITLCVIHMAQYLVYTLLAIVITISREELPWLQCPANYSAQCWVLSMKCDQDAPCINETRHLSTYIYWQEVYMKGIVPRDLADVGMVPLHRLVALMLTWSIVWCTMTMKLKKIKLFIKTSFIVLLIHKFFVFILFIVWKEFFYYLPNMISMHFASLINFTAWKNAVIKVILGMGLGDFSYIMFGILSKSDRKTGGLLWFCGMLSFCLTLMDHIIISGVTYYLCDKAKLPIEQRYLLFHPTYVEHELGVIPVILAELMGSKIWSTMYFIHRFLVLLFHAMLNYSFLQLSLYQKYPALQAYAVYVKPIFCILGFCVCLALDSKEALAFRCDIQLLVFYFCDLFNIFIMTVIVFYIYGVAKFYDDLHFIMQDEPALFWAISWVLLPPIIMLSLPVYLFDYSDSFYTFRITILAVFYSPYIIFLTITVAQKIIQKKLLTLLRSSKEWGPLNPEAREHRKSFNPRFDSKRKNKSYKCAHKCLIKEEAPPSDVEEDDIISKM